MARREGLAFSGVGCTAYGEGQKRSSRLICKRTLIRAERCNNGLGLCKQPVTLGRGRIVDSWSCLSRGLWIGWVGSH
eukprot:XP_001695609.1 predicted protein [Chlamydomonas reinhardtii]